MCFAGRMMMEGNREERRKINCTSCYFNGMEHHEIQNNISHFAKEGAVAALQEIGFYDEAGCVDKKAVSDFISLRSMLRDWRDFKKTTWQAITKWVMWIALGLLAVKLGVADLLKLGKG